MQNRKFIFWGPEQDFWIMDHIFKIFNNRVRLMGTISMDSLVQKIKQKQNKQKERKKDGQLIGLLGTKYCLEPLQIPGLQNGSIKSNVFYHNRPNSIFISR